MTDEDSKFEEWWTSRGNQPYSTLWTTGKSAYLAGLVEGRRLERERITKFMADDDNVHNSHDVVDYKWRMLDAIRGKGCVTTNRQPK